MSRLTAAFAVASLLIIAAAPAASAQAIALGADGVYFKLPDMDEATFGGGVRITTDFGRIGFDAGFWHFPQKQSYHGETLWLGGARVRLLGAARRLYVRVRGGRVHFDGDFFRGRLSSRHRPALDVGITLERSFGNSFAGRFDLSDVVIPFDGATYAVHPQERSLRTTHNLAVGIGIAWRIGGPNP